MIDARGLVAFLEKWDNTPWGMVVVPLGLFLAGALFLYFGCRFAERLSRRLPQTYALLTETSFAWARRLGLVILLVACLALFLQNVGESLATLGGKGSTAGFLRLGALNIRRLASALLQVSSSGARVVFLVLASVWVCRFLEEALRIFFARNAGLRGIESESRARSRLETLRSTSTYVVRLAVVIVATLVTLQALGFSIGPLLATAGVASVAIGLGAQSLIRDVVAGFFILVEDQYAVGDAVELQGRAGVVEDVTLRVTKLRHADGSVTFLPNGEIKIVCNGSADWARVDLRVRVRLDEDLARIERVIMEALREGAREAGDDVTGEPEWLGVEKLEEKCAVVRAWVRTRPLARARVERALNARVVATFAREKVAFPSFG